MSGQSAPLPAHEANRRILIIDDSPAIHEDVVKLLTPARSELGPSRDLAVARAAFFGGDVGGAHELLGAGFAAEFALLLHQFLEGVHVDLERALGAEQLCQVDWEAEGVVELEGKLAAQLSFQPLHFLFKHGQATVESFVEASFFAL